MAENEVLDVGNPFHYKRWRRALANSACSPIDVAEYLFEDFSAVLRKKLQRKPLHLVLSACGDAPSALQAAVENFKDRALAKLVEQAYGIMHSTEAHVVAVKLADLLIDGLVDRTNRHVLGIDNSPQLNSELENAASAKLEACRSEITELLTISLRGERIKRRRIKIEHVTADSLLSTSLFQGRPSAGSEIDHV